MLGTPLVGNGGKGKATYGSVPNVDDSEPTNSGPQWSWLAGGDVPAAGVSGVWANPSALGDPESWGDQVRLTGAADVLVEDDVLDDIVDKKDKKTITFRLSLLLVVLVPLVFICTGLGHAAEEQNALAAGLPETTVGIRGLDIVALLPALLLTGLLQGWVIFARRELRIILPRDMMAFVGHKTVRTNLIAWVLRSGHQQYLLLIAVNLLGTMAFLVPAAIDACQRSVLLPPAGSPGMPASPCLAAPFQVPAMFVDRACQPAVDALLYISNTAVYSSLGALVVYAVVLAVSLSAAAQAAVVKGMNDMHRNLPIATGLITQCEAYAQNQLHEHDREKRRWPVRLARVSWLIVSLLVFFGALGWAISIKVSEKLALYPALSVDFAVPIFWVTVIVASTVIVLMLGPLVDLAVNIVVYGIKYYVVPQAVLMTAFTHPRVRFGVKAVATSVADTDGWPGFTDANVIRSRPVDLTMEGFGLFLPSGVDPNLGPALTSEGRRSGSPSATAMELKVDGRSVSCPVSDVADAIAILAASRLYLLSWVAARRYQHRTVLSYTLLPVAVLIVVLFSVGVILFLVVIVGFLLPNNFELNALLQPAAIMTLYTGSYAIASSTLVAVYMVTLVDKTAVQIQNLHAAIHICRGRTDIYSVTDDITSHSAYTLAHGGFLEFLQHVVYYVEHHSETIKLWGVPVRYVYIKAVIGVATAQALALFIALIRSLANI